MNYVKNYFTNDETIQRTPVGFWDNVINQNVPYLREKVPIRIDKSKDISHTLVDDLKANKITEAEVVEKLQSLPKKDAAEFTRYYDGGKKELTEDEQKLKESVENHINATTDETSSAEWEEISNELDVLVAKKIITTGRGRANFISRNKPNSRFSMDKLIKIEKAGGN
jgi:hypothetical protein